MTMSRGRLDPALLLIPLIGLVAVWSFLTQSMPSTDDGMLFMLRLVELDRCLRHGIVPLHWAPDFAHGYGYPLFNYYASLSLYVGELWHLSGLDFPQAIAAATVSAFFISGWGAYLLGRDLGAGLGGSGNGKTTSTTAQKAGLIAATAYMYAPYQFYDSAYRGNLAETWALALLPWVLWTGRRAVWSQHWRDIVPCAVSYAALVYTHNVYTLLGSPLLGAYLLFLWLVKHLRQPGGDRRVHTALQDAVRLAAAIGLGLALSAFFWLPMFFEKEWTHFSTDLVDYRTFFLSAGELLAWPPQVDLSLLNYYPPRSLSWGMLLLVAVSIALGLVTRRQKRNARILSEQQGHSVAEWAFFLSVLVLAAFMTIRPSDWIWRTVPLLDLALIPWRYLGIASLAGGLVAGTMIGHMQDNAAGTSPALIAAGGAMALLVMASVPWTYAAPFPQAANIGVPEMMRWEYDTGLIGTTAKNEYLPIWSPRMPDEPADRSLLTDHDPIIARLDTSTLPQGARVISANYGLLRADLDVETPVAFRALYRQFYFPGWQVLVDGKAVPQIVTEPYGLLGFVVPPGRHRIVVKPGTTPLRLAGKTISALALCTTLVIVGTDATRRAKRLKARRSPHSAYVAPRIGHLLALAVLALLILGLKEGIVDRTTNLFRAPRLDGQRVPGLSANTLINLGNTLTLYGYNLPTTPIASGGPLRVDLYLGARQPPPGEYMAYARLVDEQGRLWSLPDNGAPEGFRGPPPTTLWPNDAYAHWSYLAYILPGTPPGEYQIEVAVFERDTWRGLNVLDERGRIVAQKTIIGPIQIKRSRRPPDLDTLDIGQMATVQVTEGLQSLGSTLDAGTGQAHESGTAVRAGERLDVTLFWRATRPLDQAYRLRLDLSSQAGIWPLADGLPLGREPHPTTAWLRGEIVRSPHRLRIPATVGKGDYILQGTLVDERGSDAAAPVPFAEITVKPTSRLMAIPEQIQVRTDVNLGSQIVLLGYDLPTAQVQPGETLSVTLYWQATREMDTSYKVFLQLLGPDGVLAQVDAIPADWRRPTTGWIPGEVIVDAYALVGIPNLTADQPKIVGQLIVGLYDEQTLQRLAVVDPSGTGTADDFILLSSIEIAAPEGANP